MIAVVALVLLVDVSISVDDNEYQLQRDGIASAFLDPGVQRAIVSSGGACVTLIEWADRQVVTVQWTPIRTADEATIFAGMVAATTRSHRGWTHAGDALLYGVQTVLSNPCGARQRVIDVSGDGCRNKGAPMEPARILAEHGGVQINGLAILGDPRAHADCEGLELDQWYRERLATGFVLVAEDFDAFAFAFRRKLALEIAAR